VSEHETTPPHTASQPAPTAPALPRDLVLLPLLNTVIYPLTVTPLAIGQETAVRLVDEAISDGRMVGMVALRGSQRPERLAAEDIFTVGTAAVVHRMVRLHDNTLRVAVEGVTRFAVEHLITSEPPHASVRPLAEPAPDRAARAEARALAAAAAALARRLPAQGAALLTELANEPDPLRLSYLAAARLLLRASLAERQELLELARPTERLARLRAALERDLATLEASQG
jgi:ATP-dependent Lon protease